MPNRRYTSGVQNGLLQRLALVLAVCIAVYWLLLGSSSFAMSEAQRALPAWEMADRGEWLIPYLFDQPYLRKPPGVQWLIMASSKVFGQTEFAARVPSALCMTLGALASTWFAARWFAVRLSHYAGLVHALTPLYWYPGRAAEIESPHNFFVQVLILASIDLLVHRSRSWMMSWIVMIGVIGALMTKGPAGAPCVAAVLVVAGVMNRSWRSSFDPRWLVGASVGGVIAAMFFVLISRKAANLDPVVQSPADFLWNGSKIADILTLGPVTILAALPASLGLIAAMIRPVSEHMKSVQAVTWTVVLSLAIYTCAGVSNNRYAMPTLTIASVLMPALIAVLMTRDARRSRLSIGALHVMFIALFLGSFAHTAWSETRRERISGRKAGEAIARLLRDGEQVWANQAIEYRAEIMYYAVQEASRRGVTVYPKWMPAPGRGAAAVAPPGLAAIVLMDQGAVKDGAMFEHEANEWPSSVRELVHKYDVELRRAP